MHEVAFFPDHGYVLCGRAEDAAAWLVDMHCIPAVVIADPPYGDILQGEVWEDKAELDNWIGIVRSIEQFKCPIYWWGGIGKPRNRPFFQFILGVELGLTQYRMRDLITWKKVRGFGKPKDYLFTREECAYLTFMGEMPAVFNIPLLDEKRGYAGYNAKYPAKSEYKRRSNVWVETELLRDKVHAAQKAPAVTRVPIEVHTKERELVLDLYSGSGETSVQAVHLDRTFIAVEKNLDIAHKIAKRLEQKIRETEVGT